MQEVEAAHWTYVKLRWGEEAGGKTDQVRGTCVELEGESLVVVANCDIEDVSSEDWISQGRFDLDVRQRKS